MALTADPRGSTETGERVLVLAGVSKPSNENRIRFTGTVEQVAAEKVTVLMDDLRSPGALSGSPVLNMHGAVVGILVTCNWQSDSVRIGVNPVATVIAAAQK